MRKDRGDTLLEVIVAIVILGILAGVALNSFADARKVNRVSIKYIQAENIAVTLLEEAKNIDFDYLVKTSDEDYFDPAQPACVAKIPAGYSTLAVWDVDDKTDSHAKLSIAPIQGDRARFRAEVIMDSTAYEDNYNNEQFVDLSTISEEKTCVVDSVGATNIYTKSDGEFLSAYTTSDLKYFLQSTAGSYDNQAVQHFLELNSAYVTSKWKQECARIDEFNANHADEGIFVEYPVMGEGAYTLVDKETIKAHLNKTTEITVSKNSLFHFVTAQIKYSLQQNTGSGWVSIIEDESAMANSKRDVGYSLFKDSKYVDLENVYLMYAPLSDDWHSDKIKLVNGTDLTNGCNFNFYLIEQPFNCDGEANPASSSVNGNPTYAAPSVTVTSTNPLNSITLYTNTALTMASPGLAGNVDTLITDKTHILEDKYTRLFEITVNIYDSDKGALLCTKKTSILR